MDCQVLKYLTASIWRENPSLLTVNCDLQLAEQCSAQHILQFLCVFSNPRAYPSISLLQPYNSYLHGLSKTPNPSPRSRLLAFLHHWSKHVQVNLVYLATMLLELFGQAIRGFLALHASVKNAVHVMHASKKCSYSQYHKIICWMAVVPPSCYSDNSPSMVFAGL